MSLSAASSSTSSASNPALPPMPSALAKQQLERSGGRKLGTLVVVVIKARNLPNKQRIGKQDPYCSVQLGHQKNKTQAVKRGGQTPHWDAQLEFEVWEQRGDETPVVATESGGIAPAVDDADLPNQATVGRAKGKSTAAASKKILKIACYADDPREPELIGETELDYGPTLKKGEFDEWVELKYRGKYAGEVFIEMTFYSAAPPPVKRKSKPAIPGSGYGGPGHFEPLPVSISQSPSSSPASKPRPSSTRLTAGMFQQQQQHPLRSSQSSYSLASSSAASSSTVTEFGARPTSAAGNAFPMPQHYASTSGSGSTASSSHSLQQPPQGSLRPHRASFSSYGMTQHDIDSLTRPLSSLSISSVNKPLPMPQPNAGQLAPALFPEPGPSTPRPTSGQAYHRPSSAQPYSQPQQHFPPTQAYSPAPHAQAYQAQAYPDDPRPDLPHASHRHSLATYSAASSYPQDEPAYSNWNNAQIQPLPAEDPNVVGLHRPPPSSSWQDPRGPSPFEHSGALSTSPQPGGGRHPAALQPGLLTPSSSSAGFPQSPPPARQNGFTPPLPPRSPTYDQSSQGQYPATAAYSGSPAPPHQQPAYDNYPPQHQAPGAPAIHGEPYVQPYDAYRRPHQPEYGLPEHQAYHQPAQPDGVRYDQPGGHQSYHQEAPAPPPQPSYSPAPPSLPPQLANDAYRSNSPYRPLPQPTPEPHYVEQVPQQYASLPPPQPYQQQVQQQSYNRSYDQGQQYDQQYEIAHPPAQHQQGVYQPRFGLPPHQPYDQPYYGGSQHQQTPPPPLPPVPQELRQGEHHAQQQHRYNQYY